MSMPFAAKIDDEAKILSKSSDDLDNFRRFYSLKEESPDETILIQFVAPKIIAFEDYRFYLLQNSVTKPLKPSRYYRPDYVSYDEYGTINLWALLLFINEIPTLEDFNVENILIPSPASIVSISKDILSRDLLHELVPLTDYPPVPTPALFSRQMSVPRFETTAAPIPVFTPTDVYFVRESFTVDVVMARDRYVDLQNEAVADSIILNVKDQPNYLYGKHYTMIRGSKGNNRLTWDPRKITRGVGLMSVLVEGTQFEVTYARKVRI